MKTSNHLHIIYTTDRERSSIKKQEKLNINQNLNDEVRRKTKLQLYSDDLSAREINSKRIFLHFHQYAGLDFRNGMVLLFEQSTAHAFNNMLVNKSRHDGDRYCLSTVYHDLLY